MSETTETPPHSDALATLEDPIRKLASFVEKLPTPYRQAVFVRLLDDMISTNSNVLEPNNMGQYENGFVMPISVKALLAQFDIPESNINRHFMIRGQNEIAPIYKLKTKKIARAQIQISCLLALENALKDGKFEFSIGDVRDKCKHIRCYDGNFEAIFESKEKLFKNKTGDRMSLTPEGKEYLADTLDELSNKA